MNIEELTIEEKRLIDNYRNGSRYIEWTVEDFRNQAIVYANSRRLDYKTSIDESKFQYALDEMIRKHDAIIGITWDTIDEYIREYCMRSEDD